MQKAFALITGTGMEYVWPNKLGKVREKLFRKVTLAVVNHFGQGNAPRPVGEPQINTQNLKK